MRTITIVSGGVVLEGDTAVLVAQQEGSSDMVRIEIPKKLLRDMLEPKKEKEEEPKKKGAH